MNANDTADRTEGEDEARNRLRRLRMWTLVCLAGASLVAALAFYVSYVMQSSSILPM